MMLSIYVNEIFMVVLLCVAILLGIYSMLLKCPNCGKKVLQNSYNILGLEMELWTVWIPKKCQKCGETIE